MLLNCIIVDDDKMSIKATKRFVDKHDHLKCIAEFTSAKAALAALPDLKVDLIFLDIEMPEMNGLEFINSLTTIPQIIVISGKSEYAAEAFDFNVTDYLVKPVDYDRFEQAVDKTLDVAENFRVSRPEMGVFFVKKDSKLVKVDANEIRYVEAQADYVSIYVDDKKRHTILSTMKNIESKLSTDEFVRIHRSYIVRIDRIEEIDNNVVSIGNKLLPVSRSYKQSLLEKLNLF